MMNELITIHTRFQHRRAIAARWAEVNPILREGELGVELEIRRRRNEMEQSGILLERDSPSIGHRAGRNKGRR